MLVVLISAPPALAEPFSLAMPVDCVLGESCYIQNHFDHDPGPGFEDYACGPLGYDEHAGVDFALPDLAAMAAGVDVLAAAPGEVLGTRDGMPDVSFRDPGAPDLATRECGNGVSIEHGDGWTTQYCHLARGSVTVRPGERVEAGRPLGRIGLSGQTEFPHLHLSLRRDGERVDPFDVDGAGCDGEPAALWAEPIPYVATGLASVGLLDRVPDWGEVRAGGLVPYPEGDAAPLVLWGHAFGGRPGDVMRLRIEGPDGTVMEEAPALDRAQAAYYRAQGVRPPEGEWPPGTYTGHVDLVRDGAVVDRGTTEVAIP